MFHAAILFHLICMEVMKTEWSFFSLMKAGGKFGLKPRRIEHRGLSDSALEASFCVYVVERSSSFCHSQWLNDKGYFNFFASNAK